MISIGVSACGARTMPQVLGQVARRVNIDRQLRFSFPGGRARMTMRLVAGARLTSRCSRRGPRRFSDNRSRRVVARAA